MRNAGHAEQGSKNCCSYAITFKPRSYIQQGRVVICSTAGFFYHTVLLIYKIRQSNQPEYLAMKLKNDSRNGRIVLPKIKLQLTKHSFCQRGASAWNQLPRHIRELATIGSFKVASKKWVIENIPRF